MPTVLPSSLLRTLFVAGLAQVKGLYGFCQRIGKPFGVDGDDLFQEAFLKTLQSGRDFKDADHLRRFFCRVAANVAHDAGRRKRSAERYTEHVIRTMPVGKPDAEQQRCENREFVERLLKTAASVYPGNKAIGAALAVTHGGMALEEYIQKEDIKKAAGCRRVNRGIKALRILANPLRNQN